MKHSTALIFIIVILACTVMGTVLVRVGLGGQQKEYEIEFLAKLCSDYYHYTDVSHQTIPALEQKCYR